MNGISSDWTTVTTGIPQGSVLGLRFLGLPTLQYRRMRADVIQVFKIINGIDKIDEDIFKVPLTQRTRGNSKRIFKKQ